MSVHDRWLTAAALMLVVTIPAALGAYCVAAGVCDQALAPVLLHGPLVLVALWSALSNAPFYLRWACGALALWAVCRPVGCLSAFWEVHLVWHIVPHVMLTFTVLCLLRELGLRIRPLKDVSRHAADELRWRFTLRSLLGWVAGAALLTLAWKHTFDVLFPVPSMALSPWRPAAYRLIVTFSLTALDLLALGALLRPGQVRWRLVLLLIAAALQTLVRSYVDEALFGLRPSWDSVFHIYLADLCYLVPVSLALALVRSGGDRWTADQSLSP